MYSASCTVPSQCIVHPVQYLHSGLGWANGLCGLRWANGIGGLGWANGLGGLGWANSLGGLGWVNGRAIGRLA